MSGTVVAENVVQTEASDNDLVAMSSTPPKDKAELYSKIAEFLNQKATQRFEPVKQRVKAAHNMDISMRRPFGDEDGRNLTVFILKSLIGALVTPDENGQIKKGRTIGLPGGMGSFEILTAGATMKKTPQGKTVPVEERWRVKWNTGKEVHTILSSLPKPEPDPVVPGTEVPAAKDGVTAQVQS